MSGRSYFSPEKWILYIVLIFFALVFLYPFIWMLYTSVKSDTEILDPNPLALPKVKYFAQLPSKEGQKKPQYIEVIPYFKVKMLSGTQSGSEILEVKKSDLTRKKGKLLLPDGHPVELLKFGKNDMVKTEVAVKRVSEISEKIREYRYGELKKRRFLFENFPITFKKDKNFILYLRNSLMYSITAALLQLILATCAAFAFARFEFKGKEVIFTLFLSTMMIPSQMLLIPNYLIISKLGLYNSMPGVILPYLANITNIFLLRQFFKAIPHDLFDSVKIDGGSVLHQFIHIALPLSQPILVTTALFSFITEWNSFIWILIITNDPTKQTLQVGLSNFSQSFGTDWNLLMSASTIVIMPLVVLYFFVQKRIIESLARTGIKG